MYSFRLSVRNAALGEHEWLFRLKLSCYSVWRRYAGSWIVRLQAKANKTVELVPIAMLWTA